METFVGYPRSKVALVECKSCAGGGSNQPAGPFALCTVIKGEFQGSCLNCAYSGETGRCSLIPAENKGKKGLETGMIRMEPKLEKSDAKLIPSRIDALETAGKTCKDFRQRHGQPGSGPQALPRL